MKTLLLALLALFTILAYADVGYIETLETSPIQGTYCSGFGLVASVGAKAQWDGAPLKFIIIDKSRYYELMAEQIEKTGWADMPNDGIYMVVSPDDSKHEVEGQQAFLTYGWEWMSKHPNVPLDPSRIGKPNWKTVDNMLADECNAKHLQQQFMKHTK